MSAFASLDKEIEEARKKQSRGRFSETASAHRQAAWTPAQMRLGTAISNLRSVPFKLEEEFTRPEEFTQDGRNKTYRVDNLLFPQASRRIALETEGEGTSSDDPKRDATLLQAHNVRVVHVPNEVAFKYAWLLADLVDALYWALAGITK